MLQVTYFLFASYIMQVLLLVSFWTFGFNLFLKCVISQELMVSLMYVLTWWDLVPTSPWGNLHPVATAMLIVTIISIRKHPVLQTVSIGNRFWWLYINRFQSAWFWCIIIKSGIFPWSVSREGGGSMFLKKGRGY